VVSSGAGRKLGASLRPEEIYAAAFDADAFSRLPQLLAQAAGARSGLINWRHHDGAFEVMGFTHFTPELVAAFPQFLPSDPWTIEGAARPNRLLLLDRLVPDATFEGSLPYNELFRPHGDDTFRCIGTVFSTPWGSGILSVHRGRAQQSFDERDHASLAAVLDHFKKVLLVRGELASARRALELARIAQDSLDLALITVRADGRILSANACAEVVLARGDGLRVRDGMLTARVGAAALLAAIARAAAPSEPAANSVLVERGPNLPPYLLTAAPLATAGGRASALVLFRDPDSRDPALVDRLRTLFALTPAEAAIAVELASGRTLADLSQSRNASPNTLRNQLKSLAAKLGVSRQAEVAALVAALPGVRALGA
jgi:DNA-binding CsgD family transcriptional regulator